MDSEDTLVLTGSGAVTEAGWPDYMQAITTVVVSVGVSGIGGNILGSMQLIQRVVFRGNPPALSEAAFAGISAEAFYPHGHGAWTAAIAGSYGGSVSWSMYCGWQDGGVVAARIEHRDAVAPACTEAGNNDCWRCAACGRAFADEAATEYLDESEYIVQPLGHDTGAPEFHWTEDHSACEASFLCARCGETQAVEAEVTSERVVEPGCEMVGSTAYTAAALFQEETYTDTVELTDIPALGHDWGEAGFEWAEDGHSATATHICGRDDQHVETQTVETESAVSAEPTWNVMGQTTYTASFENEAFGTQTLILSDIPTVPLTGRWGSAAWTLHDGTLTVTGGAGAATGGVSPWASYAADILEMSF